jgi:hypothetical protein
MDENLVKYGQENFSLPHDVITLPTGGRFYKSKKKSVKVGYLTAADENLLMSNSADIVTQLIRSKLYEPDLKSDELMQGDIEAILIFLRNTAFGPEYKINLVDPDTGDKFETSILLDELNIKKPEVEPDDNGYYSTVLPKSEVPVKLKPLSTKELNEINDLAKTYPNGRIAPRITWLLQKQIVEVNGIKDQGEINKFITSMPILDSKYVREFLDKNEPRLDLVKTVFTPSGKKIDVAINFGVEFFRVFF